MGLFGQSTPFDADIEKATSETNTNENWSLILDVCDKVTSNPRSAKDCLKAVMRRMGHTDPHVVMQAITLLDACVNNCGKSFHLEIASRDFENEFRRLLVKAQPKVSARMRQVLKSWAEGDFKSDPELSLIPALYEKLRSEGYEFNNLSEKPKSATRATALSKDPNVVSTQQEEDDIAKAIELSLKENKSSPKLQQKQAAVSTTSSSAYPSLYPSVAGGVNVSSTTTTTATTAAINVEPRKVRALYDFEAAEDNELTFYAGEILHVLDDSDPNWWKGFNQRGEGLFPSNFVTADLSADPERIDINLSKMKAEEAQQAEQEKKIENELANQRIEIDEVKVDRLLHLLHEANPEDRSQDTEEMLRLEQEVHQMGPLIDAELERVDRKHAQLTQLSSDLVDAINMYHSLMRDDRAAMMSAGAAYMPPGMTLPGMPGLPPNSYTGNTNPPQMLFGAYGGAAHFPHMPHATSSTMPAGMTFQPPAMQHAVPIQYQNGHASNNVMPQMMYAPQQQPPQPTAQQPLYVPNGQQQQQPQHQQTQIPPTASQLQQQQHQMPIYTQHQGTPQTATTQFMPPSVQHTATGVVDPHNGTQFISSTQQSQQPPPTAIGGYMQIPLHQPQQQQPQQLQQSHHSYAMPNGVQGAYMPAPSTNNNSNGLNAEQLNQLQQQMAAMGMGNQPVTQNFLVQNEPKNNIPIYQQQR